MGVQENIEHPEAERAKFRGSNAVLSRYLGKQTPG